MVRIPVPRTESSAFRRSKSYATASPAIQFKGALRIHPPHSDLASQVQLFATPGTHLWSYYSTEHESNNVPYVGCTRPSRCPRADIPAWCAGAQWAGERMNGLVISLGPLWSLWTNREKPSTLSPTRSVSVRSSSASIADGWCLAATLDDAEAGLRVATSTAEALSCWIAYGIAGTGGSLFTDLRRLAPGAALVIEKGNATEIPYTHSEPDRQAFRLRRRPPRKCTRLSRQPPRRC